jgi:HSP20 family molecular chaperone IbpA
MRVLLISTNTLSASPSGPAYAISDRTYILDPNPLGWEQDTPLFERDTAAATLTLNANEPYPVGLDGRFRRSESPNAVPQASRGEWISGTTFRVELIEIGSFNEYVITMTFAGDEVETVVVDTTTSSLNVRIHGKAED